MIVSMITRNVDCSGKLVSHFTYGLDLTSLQSSSGTSFYQFDGSANTATVTGSGGAVLDAYSYLPFGEKLQSTVTVTNPFTFAGQVGIRDDGNGLYYMRARYYDPTIGRFIREDPIGFGGGINMYDYVGGNPISFRDPLGLYWVFSQSTGQWSHVDDQTGQTTTVGRGYSGTSAGRNNPNMQNVHDVGPTPRGNYDIGPGHYSPKTGPNTMNLTPQSGTNTFGRTLLRIHGDNATHDASTGCAIAPLSVRKQINNSNDHVLHVVP